MFDILAYLVERYFDLGDYPDLDTLPRQLAAAGFQTEEIEQALRWLSGLRGLSPHSAVPRTERPSGAGSALAAPAHRLYALAEQHKIALAARGYLMFLEANGVLDSAQREVVIERITALAEPEVRLDQVKLVVLLVLWNQGQHLNALIVDELLASDRHGLLH